MNRLHEKSDAIDFVELRLEAANHIRSADFALGQRPEIDLDAAAVKRGVSDVDADERGKAVHGLILEDYVCQGLLALAHSAEGDALGSFGDAENYAGVLRREKSFGNIHVKENGAHERGESDDQRDGAEAENEF